MGKVKVKIRITSTLLFIPVGNSILDFKIFIACIGQTL